MSYRSRYDKGDWKVICDVCGREFKASILRQRWDGLMVCQDDWEPRQPQDFVRGVADVQAPPWTRPEASDTFVSGFSASVTITANYQALSTDGTIYANNSVPITVSLPVSPASNQLLTVNNIGTSTVAIGTLLTLSLPSSVTIQWTGTKWQIVLGTGQVN